MKQEEELIQPLRITEQLTMRALANFISSFKCDKWLELVIAIKFMIKDPNIKGEEILKKEYKEKYQEKIAILNMTHYNQIKIKPYYETITGKQITDKDITTERFKIFKKNNKQTIIINTTVIEIFYTLYNKTTMKERSIPAEAFAQAYKTYKNFEITEEETKIRNKQAEEEIDEDY